LQFSYVLMLRWSGLGPAPDRRANVEQLELRRPTIRRLNRSDDSTNLRITWRYVADPATSSSIPFCTGVNDEKVKNHDSPRPTRLD
jgi:hypothetical protein